MVDRGQPLVAPLPRGKRGRLAAVPHSWPAGPPPPTLRLSLVVVRQRRQAAGPRAAGGGRLRRSLPQRGTHLAPSLRATTRQRACRFPLLLFPTHSLGERAHVVLRERRERKKGGAGQSLARVASELAPKQAGLVVRELRVDLPSPPAPSVAAATRLATVSIAGRGGRREPGAATRFGWQRLPRSPRRAPPLTAILCRACLRACPAQARSRNPVRGVASAGGGG